jgi:hypothetical protein
MNRLALLTLTLVATLTSPASATLWDNPDTQQDGWKYFTWYGWIVDAGNGWIYHIDHGWTYAVGESSESIWFYDQEMGWTFSGNTSYPFYFVPAAGEWLYFQGGVSPRVFHGKNLGWVTVNRKPTAAPELFPGNYDWQHREFTESEEHELLSWTRNFVTTEFDTQIIENDLLRITLLPDWGARILSIFYKPQGIELLSYAKGEKRSDLILADGAFYYDNWLLLPGGINPTFPEGEHGKYWGEVWAFQSVEETADHITVRMSRTDDLEWAGTPEKFNNGLTGMSVDMDITVPRNKACVEIAYTLTNNKNETIAYEFWTAASLAPLPPELTATSSNLEIVMKQEKIILRDFWNWMADVETDDENPGDDVVLFDKLAWQYNWVRSGIAYAYPLMDNPWWGVINHDYDWGVFRTADDASIAPGMKIWGTGANYGMFELWSGISAEFFEDAFLEPLEIKTWKEYFIPTVGLSAISHANQHGAAQGSLEYGATNLTIDLSVFSTWQPANWRLSLQAIPQEGSPVLIGSSALNFTPDQPTETVTLSAPIETLPEETLAIEAVLIDLFTGEERMRFEIGED